ncbi:hypothetical protein [Paludisphaera mucosa]|uniref:Uncharacterized protein n=1 Tax=Paludisphaera mucosa TaxID=3030827 RepID=A0ABT6F5E1_9BACT|nr:hypothetical protein [Paludisphaera mucosa]MDG3002795.1 hypothetical protein [Paludisphaera mucosa]
MTPVPASVNPERRPVGSGRWGGETPSGLIDAVKNRPLARLQIRSEDGRVLQA